jgi:hypothetical protein
MRTLLSKNRKRTEPRCAVRRRPLYLLAILHAAQSLLTFLFFRHQSAAALAELEAMLQLINDTDIAAPSTSAVPWQSSWESTSGSRGARQVTFYDWTKFCENARNGVVTPTCVIDFPYADKEPGGLNLDKNQRLLERMYCFKDQNEDTRVVLHVHTLLPWVQRLNTVPGKRASRVTSVNVRHAHRVPGKFKQEGVSMHLVPVAESIRCNWRKRFSQGRGNSLEWSWENWENDKRFPSGEIVDQASSKRYGEVLFNTHRDSFCSVVVVEHTSRSCA